MRNTASDCESTASIQFFVEVIEEAGELGVGLHLGADAHQLVLAGHLFVQVGLQETVGQVVLRLQTRLGQLVDVLRVGLLRVEYRLEGGHGTLPGVLRCFLFVRSKQAKVGKQTKKKKNTGVSKNTHTIAR
jgi:hypothetical protein